MNKDSALIFEAYEQNRIVGNYVMQDDQVIGEFLGDSYSSKLTLHGKQMFMPRAPYAQTVNQGTHMGLWYRNKRHKLIVKDASKWKEFLSDIVSTGDDKYWDGKQMHQHDHLGKKIAATNAYWTKKIAAGADQHAEDAETPSNALPFTVVSGGVDNTSDVGMDINPADHIEAQNLKHAVEGVIEDMQNDEDFDDTFPQEYREYVQDMFIMSNDSGDFHAVIPGHLNDNQIFDKLIAARDHKSENAEDRSVQAGGSIEDITDVQKQSMDMLQQHGFHVNKVSNAHAEQMGGPVVYMGKKTGAMHQVAEVDPQGMINDETPEDYLANHVHAEDEETAEQRIMAAKMAVAQAKGQIAQAKTQGQMKHYGDGLTNALGKPEQAEDAEETKQPYNAMTHLTQAANHIRHILRDNADDEAQVEHIIRMAQIILGDKKDYAEAEYRKMLDGLIVILNRFIIVPMN